MKSLILSLSLATLCFNSFSQQTTPAPVLSKQDYLKKSKSQRTTGIVLASVGGVLVIAGAMLAVEGTAEEIGGIFTGETSRKDDNGAVLFIAGTACMIGSIPLFIASGRNRKLAMSMSFRYQHTDYWQKTLLAKKNIPALSLKINL
jgi:uncharacterized membrane protein